MELAKHPGILFSVEKWFTLGMVRKNRARGGKGWVYSDLAIRCGLGLRAVFSLTLR